MQKRLALCAGTLISHTTQDPVQENKAHISLAYFQKLTINYTIVPVVYQATNKVTQNINSQSTVLRFARRPNERSSWMARRGYVDWQVCQIRLNDSNKLTRKIDHGMGRSGKLVLTPNKVLSELNSMISNFTLETSILWVKTFCCWKQDVKCNKSKKNRFSTWM